MNDTPNGHKQEENLFFFNHVDRLDCYVTSDSFLVIASYGNQRQLHLFLAHSHVLILYLLLHQLPSNVNT